MGRREIRPKTLKRFFRPATRLEYMEVEVQLDEGTDQVVLTYVKLETKEKDERQFLTYGTFGKAYRRVDSLSKHVDSCSGYPPKRQVTNRTAPLAMGIVENSETGL